MNKVIEQKAPYFECDLNIDRSEDYIYIMQCDDIVKVGKQGAAELIKVLQEWVGEQS